MGYTDLSEVRVSSGLALGRAFSFLGLDYIAITISFSEYVPEDVL